MGSNAVTFRPPSTTRYVYVKVRDQYVRYSLPEKETMPPECLACKREKNGDAVDSAQHSSGCLRSLLKKSEELEKILADVTSNGISAPGQAEEIIRVAAELGAVKERVKFIQDTCQSCVDRELDPKECKPCDDCKQKPCENCKQCNKCKCYECDCCSTKDCPGIWCSKCKVCKKWSCADDGDCECCQRCESTKEQGECTCCGHCGESEDDCGCCPDCESDEECKWCSDCEVFRCSDACSYHDDCEQHCEQCPEGCGERSCECEECSECDKPACACLACEECSEHECLKCEHCDRNDCNSCSCCAVCGKEHTELFCKTCYLESCRCYCESTVGETTPHDQGAHSMAQMKVLASTPNCEHCSALEISLGNPTAHKFMVNHKTTVAGAFLGACSQCHAFWIIEKGSCTSTVFFKEGEVEKLIADAVAEATKGNQQVTEAANPQKMGLLETVIRAALPVAAGGTKISTTAAVASGAVAAIGMMALGPTMAKAILPQIPGLQNKGLLPPGSSEAGQMIHQFLLEGPQQPQQPQYAPQPQYQPQYQQQPPQYQQQPQYATQPQYQQPQQIQQQPPRQPEEVVAQITPDSGFVVRDGNGNVIQGATLSKVAPQQPPPQYQQTQPPQYQQPIQAQPVYTTPQQPIQAQPTVPYVNGTIVD